MHPEAASSRPAAAAARRLSNATHWGQTGEPLHFAPVSTSATDDCHHRTGFVLSLRRALPIHVPGHRSVVPVLSAHPRQTRLAIPCPYQAPLGRYRRAPCRLLPALPYQPLPVPPADPALPTRRGWVEGTASYPYLPEQRVCRQKATRTRCHPGVPTRRNRVSRCLEMLCERPHPRLPNIGHSGTASESVSDGIRWGALPCGAAVSWWLSARPAVARPEAVGTPSRRRQPAAHKHAFRTGASTDR